MTSSPDVQLSQRRYRECFAADLLPNFPIYMSQTAAGNSTAALGYARAGTEPLFLEAYLDAPIEALAGPALRRTVSRAQIVEIGNLAAVSPQAMIALWGAAANDLAAFGDVAVATLTEPLRAMFRRVGIPVTEIAEARAERLGAAAPRWGAYFDQDPRVCAGVIADGQQAIAAFLGRRLSRKVA